MHKCTKTINYSSPAAVSQAGAREVTTRAGEVCARAYAVQPPPPAARVLSPAGIVI